MASKEEKLFKNSIEIPIAKQEEIIVTEYLKECIHKVATTEGFINYNLTVNYGSNIGDGYVSNMLKISINEDNHETLTVLVKIPLENKARREVMKMMSLFEREIFVYKVMLPQFEEIQRLNNLNESIRFNNFPKIYFAEFNKDKDDAIIIMDDLRESGHKMWKKSAPINFDHAKLLLTALGRYHAMSFAIRLKKPEFFQTLQHLNDDFSDVLQTPQFEVILKGSVTRIIEFFQPEEVVARDKITNLIENLKDICIERVKPKYVEPYTVMLHGIMILILFYDSDFNYFLY